MTVGVLWLFLTVQWAGLQCAIAVFPDHTHLLLCYKLFFKSQLLNNLLLICVSIAVLMYIQSDKIKPKKTIFPFVNKAIFYMKSCKGKLHIN